MKKVFTKYIADKTIIYLIGLVFAFIALISSILYIAIDGGDKSYSTTSFVLMLVGSILFIPTIFLKYDVLSIIPGLLFAFGFGEALRATLPPLSDVWNGVNFIGGNYFLLCESCTTSKYLCYRKNWLLLCHMDKWITLQITIY